MTTHHPDRPRAPGTPDPRAVENSGVRWTDVIDEPDHVALEHLSALIADGSLQVTPPRVAALEDAAEVHRQMEAGRMPKTVLRVAD